MLYLYMPFEPVNSKKRKQRSAYNNRTDKFERLLYKVLSATTRDYKPHPGMLGTLKTANKESQLK